MDFPDVIELRRKFFDTPQGYSLIGSSVADLSWVDGIPSGKPVLVLAEGLFMYLDEEDIKNILVTLGDRFPGCIIAFDAFSRLTARHARAHPSVKKTGAQFRWGVDDPKEIESWNPGIRLLEQWFFSQSEDLGKLSPGMRFMFRLAGAFKSANLAHRVLVFRLGDTGGEPK